MAALSGKQKNQTAKRRYVLTISMGDETGREYYEIDSRVVWAESVREAILMAYPKILGNN